MASRTQKIGAFQKDEVPQDLQYQFLDADSTAEDLTGYTATWHVRDKVNGTDASYAATVSTPASGLVAVGWTAAMTATVGDWVGVFWVTDGSVTMSSDSLVWTVSDGPGPS